MNKKTLPIVILILIVIVSVGILVRTLLAPVPIPATPAPDDSSAASSSITTITSFVPSTTIGANVPQTVDIPSAVTVRTPNGAIKAEVASTSEAQAKGLGGRDSLAAAHGMLFPFMSPGDYGFWMKDMRFPIDMVWISSNKKVVSVTPEISPSTYPTVFYPPLAISYVLELNSGDAQRFGIATDTQLSF
jgi:uncharacterized membrane protein (UPF0127 family)